VGGRGRLAAEYQGTPRSLTAGLRTAVEAMTGASCLTVPIGSEPSSLSWSASSITSVTSCDLQ